MRYPQDNHKKTQHPLLALSVIPAYLGVAGAVNLHIGVEPEYQVKLNGDPFPVKKDQHITKIGVSEAAQDMQTGSESIEQESVASSGCDSKNPNPTRLSATMANCGSLNVMAPWSRLKTAKSRSDHQGLLAVEGGTAAASSRIHETVANLTAQVVATFKRRMPSGGTLHIEDIQDQVELELMRGGEHKIARDYVIYREARRQERDAKVELSPESQAAAKAINIVSPTVKAPLDIERIGTIVMSLCRTTGCQRVRHHR